MPTHTAPMTVSSARTPICAKLQPRPRQPIPAQPGQNTPTPGTNNVNQGTQLLNGRKEKKRQKANIKIASLNMNGASSPSENMSYLEKWKRLSDTIHIEGVAILAVQETHLDEEMTATLQARFKKNLTIMTSAHPTNPRATCGVAFVINKKLITPEETSVHELNPGRAMQLKVRWLGNCSTTILNTYTPNDRKAHAEFWAKTNIERCAHRLPKPAFTLGDFNVMEDMIDRCPPKHDNQTAVNALKEIKQEWNIHDTWRRNNPTEKAFTYCARTQTGMTQARLDRGYVASDIEQSTFDWEIKETAVPTDHLMISVRYAPREAPYIGTGRWTAPLHLLKNEKLIEKINAKGVELQTEMTRARLERTDRKETNPQTQWETFKQEIKKTIKEVEKELHHKLTSKMNALEKDIKETNNAPDGETNEERRSQAAFLTSQLKQLKKKNAKR